MTPAALFAVDPAGLGGIVLRGPPGPVRDQWVAAIRQALPQDAPFRRMPLGITEDRLLGGIDLTATLQAGRPLAERGLLAQAHGGAVVLAMAERLPAATAARIAAVLDSGEVVLQRDGLQQRHPARIGLVALDEGLDEEGIPPALLDRLAFLVALDQPPAPATTDIQAAAARLPGIATGEGVLEGLCEAAAALGIASLRAPLLALRAARAVAALAGRDVIAAEDAALAATLVLAPRATILPQPEAPDQPEEPESPPDEAPDDAADDVAEPTGPIADVVLQAAAAAIPPGLLARLQAAAERPRPGPAGRFGAPRKAGARGRPAGIRPGDPRDGLRLNLIATLRAAAPWQRLRATAARPGLQIRRADIRVTHTKQRAETTTIFMVDASGSQALNRLAEAKGAVELLLAECYVRRDQVAVLGFRNRAAQLLLPPTRSLVRAKRSLAGMPGGGGTPLAAGIDAGCALADAVRRRGGTPALVLLTDGRPNIGRDGKPGRAAAATDAEDAARRVRAARHAALLVDTSPRPQPDNRRLAAEMGARYIPLPFADAASLSRSIRAAT